MYVTDMYSSPLDRRLAEERRKAVEREKLDEIRRLEQEGADWERRNAAENAADRRGRGLGLSCGGDKAAGWRAAQQGAGVESMAHAC